MQIVIADDNVDFTDNTARYIARNFPQTVCHKAYDGAEALKLLKYLCSENLGADVTAILDVRMPFIDGMTLGKQVRTLYPALRIVYVSAYDELKYLHMAIRVGAADYLTKPVDARELSRVLGQLMREEGETAAAEAEDCPRWEEADHVDREERQADLCEKFKEYVEANYANPDLSLESIASALFYSRSYLTMVVRARMQTTVTEYLNGVRLKNAIRLLMNERLRIEEIAQQVGFSGGNYFIRLFKSRYGMTPAVWRTYNA